MIKIPLVSTVSSKNRIKSMAYVIVAIVVFTMTSAFATDKIGSKEEAGAEAIPEITVRTKQVSIFNVPSDTSQVLWDYGYNKKNPLNYICISYTTLPEPLNNENFEKLSNYAMRFIGVPFVDAGQSPKVGFDCSGFVLFAEANTVKAVTSATCEGLFSECMVVDENHLAPGDLVFFEGTQRREGVTHVGIYLGDGYMIHVSKSRGVEKTKVMGEYWCDHFYCYARPLEYSWCQ